MRLDYSWVEWVRREWKCQTCNDDEYWIPDVNTNDITTHGGKVSYDVVNVQRSSFDLGMNYLRASNGGIYNYMSQVKRTKIYMLIDVRRTREIRVLKIHSESLHDLNEVSNALYGIINQVWRQLSWDNDDGAFVLADGELIVYLIRCKTNWINSAHCDWRKPTTNVDSVIVRGRLQTEHESGVK